MKKKLEPISPPNVTSRPSRTERRRTRAATFAALGDETRLILLAKLVEGERSSIAQLTFGTRLTRQAITKHLRVLERAKIVRCVRLGRESLFELDPRPVVEINEYLDLVCRRWEHYALLRLKMFTQLEKSE